jgi:hypothetical protein
VLELDPCVCAWLTPLSPSLTHRPPTSSTQPSTCSLDCESKIPEPTASVYETSATTGPNAGGVGRLVGKCKANKKAVKRGKKVKYTVELKNTAKATTYEKLQLVITAPVGVTIVGTRAKPALKPNKPKTSGFSNGTAVTWSNFYVRPGQKQTFSLQGKVLKTAMAAGGVLPFSATLYQTSVTNMRHCACSRDTTVDLVA